MRKYMKYLMLALMAFGWQTLKAQGTNSAINPVLNAYFGVEKSLASDNSTSANKNAAELVAAVKHVKVSELNAAQKAAWNTYGEKLRYNSEHISESKSIDHQREHFAALSDDLYGLLKTFTLESTVYRQYCPMKKQYWLNASASIQNPYYGKKMLDCGKVTETIQGTGK